MHMTMKMLRLCFKHMVDLMSVILKTHWKKKKL